MKDVKKYNQFRNSLYKTINLIKHINEDAEYDTTGKVASSYILELLENDMIYSLEQLHEYYYGVITNNLGEITNEDK